MAFKNVPFRSEVLSWDPDTLADYFKKVSPALRGLGGWAKGVQAECERRERQRGASSLSEGAALSSLAVCSGEKGTSQGASPTTC